MLEVYLRYQETLRYLWLDLHLLMADPESYDFIPTDRYGYAIEIAASAQMVRPEEYLGIAQALMQPTYIAYLREARRVLKAARQMAR